MTPFPQPETPEPLKVVAWRYVPSDVWREVVLTEAPAKAALATEMGRAVDELVLKSDAEAAIQAARNEAEAMRADAERYLAFFSAGLPITFLGQSYETKEELDAAIDAAMKEDAHA